MNDKNDFDILTTPQEWEDINLYNLWRDTNLLSNFDFFNELFLNKDGISYCESGGFLKRVIHINFTFKFIGQNTLKLTYLESPEIEGVHFEGFTPTENNLTKEIIYQIVEVTENRQWNKNEKDKIKQCWLLTLNESPFPDVAAYSHFGKLEYFGSR